MIIFLVMSGNAVVLTLFLTLTLSACFEPKQTVIHNRSGADRNIRVLYPAGLTHPYDPITDTPFLLNAYDHTLTENAISSRDYYRYYTRIPIQALDTINRSYTFFLKAKHEVIIEARWSASTPTFGQVFIIDNTDTIYLKRRGKDFKKRGGSWTHTITGSSQ